MTTVIYWFRNDLRLADNPALLQACQQATHLLPVYCHAPDSTTPDRWGVQRSSAHRRRILVDTLADLAGQLERRGSGLVQLTGRPAEVLLAQARQAGVTRVVCEDIAAPEEMADIAALRQAGLTVDTVWQSTLIDPADLPFSAHQLPDVFSTFRQAVERAGLTGTAPVAAPHALPPLPVPFADGLNSASNQAIAAAGPEIGGTDDPRSSFPYRSPAYAGGETAAAAHLQHYFSRKLPHSYKDTRNGLAGTEYSSKWSPWLASGALSPRVAYAGLQAFEAEHGANDGSYWLWFELMWRDYFRLLHLKYGRRLYRASGLAHGAAAATPPHNAQGFARWRNGLTGEPLVDAGMRELAATGYLSNRLRQVVASYLIHDLSCDWRAGAAWFESQLVDYDVYSNQGNWLYTAGRGTDPRGGRRFNPQKQARDYDPDGSYRALWASAA